MAAYLVGHEVLTPAQHGFIKRTSCPSNLLAFLDEDEGQHVEFCYLDFSKAFDSIKEQRVAEFGSQNLNETNDPSSFHGTALINDQSFHPSPPAQEVSHKPLSMTHSASLANPEDFSAAWVPGRFRVFFLQVAG
ncbi:unnamed protein product [Echinostoma caproni]|uniref:Reverse transcriptase domain-containing protein n=1 Tax=Echinostoma caproni TaxID=27848 RepID=A0A183ANT9_9TREM|nr:unnamed protein product [Echinostoma caproni]